MSAFEAFNMVGLMQLCLRMAIPSNVRTIALDLARRFEGKVNEAAPGLEGMMGMGYDERYDRDEHGKPLGPDPNCPNCDGTGGVLPGGRCGVCWAWDPAQYPDRVDGKWPEVGEDG
jgi:hypothetical protein